MRKCNQKQCAFLKLNLGCCPCKECKAIPFMVRDDCDICYNCENIPNSCRWDDETTIDTEDKQIEKEKPIEVKQK